MPVMAKKVLLLAAAGLLLAGCGVRGPLQNPKADALEGVGSSAPSGETTATAESGQGKPANTASKPHQGFILDGLLR
jgi:predicted small lipoprotein YifL